MQKYTPSRPVFLELIKTTEDKTDVSENENLISSTTLETTNDNSKFSDNSPRSNNE